MSDATRPLVPRSTAAEDVPRSHRLRRLLCRKGNGVMPEDTDWQRLLDRIKDRRETLDVYLRAARPRADHLTQVSIVSSALAAALTAGPAVGGQRFVDRVAGELEIGGSAVWRPLCLLAMLISIVAAISTNLSKSKNTEARIVSVEATNAELEGLQALIEFDQVALEDAIKLYQQYVARVPFVSETLPIKKKSGRFQRPSPT